MEHLLASREPTTQPTETVHLGLDERDQNLATRRGRYHPRRSFNERLGDTQDALAHLVTQCDLADPHANAHGTNGEPSTYSRGTKQLDYVFISPRILPFIQKYGIHPFHQVIFTDHRGLFLDMDLKDLLGGVLAQIQAPKARGVSSHTDKPKVYAQALHKHLTDNNVFTTANAAFAKATPLDRVPADLVLAINKLDRTITQVMLLAEN